MKILLHMCAICNLKKSYVNVTIFAILRQTFPTISENYSSILRSYHD